VYRATMSDEQRRQYRDTKARWRKSPAAAAYRLMNSTRTRIAAAMKDKGARKHSRTLTLLGCTVEKYRAYLEAKFLPGMTWDNHGEWHVDHIIAVSRFNLSTKAGQRAAFRYTNTQPLWGPDNIRKGVN